MPVSQLVAPHGGVLQNLIVGDERARSLRDLSSQWPSWDLTPRQLCDLELLLTGAFSPLGGFMGQRDYESVVERMRLFDGTLWPIPIVLDVPEAVASTLDPGTSLALRDPEGVMLAVLHVEERWAPDRTVEAEAVYGTTNVEHPGVAALLNATHPWALAGRLEGVTSPVHYDFRHLRISPANLRAQFERDGWHRVVAFQTRNPMHRAHQELTLRAAQEADAKLLIHPVVGLTKPGDVDHYTRVRCYQAIADTYPHHDARLALLPLAMRMAGPREALWHAIIRKNYGCSHFIVGRDHAGPGRDSSGRPFYDPYAAQALMTEHERELGVTMVPFRNMVYVKDLDRYFPDDEVPEGRAVLDISGTELRRLLTTGGDIPSWFTFPAVVNELRATHPPRSRQGLTVFFTGLSGSGKSTIANIVLSRLLEIGGRSVSLLDGDLVRKHLSSELGFSKAHRDLNIQRIGYVASEITKAGGIALCAPIAPYDSVRRAVRAMVEPLGGFVLVHISTPLEVCESRDRKGLYAKARAGVIKQFTGISDPYEAPADAEVTLDTSTMTAGEAADAILNFLQSRGYLAQH